jgi:hypothetical protein
LEERVLHHIEEELGTSARTAAAESPYKTHLCECCRKSCCILTILMGSRPYTADYPEAFDSLKNVQPFHILFTNKAGLTHDNITSFHNTCGHMKTPTLFCIEASTLVSE